MEFLDKLFFITIIFWFAISIINNSPVVFMFIIGAFYGYLFGKKIANKYCKKIYEFK